MTVSIDVSGTKLEGKEKDAVIAFCEALQKAFTTNIQSINLYGSATRDDFRPGKSDINLLVVMNHIDVGNLKSVLDPVNRARRYRISPFFITEENIRSSADVFPVKFFGMRESYKVLFGRDILGDLKISREYLRLRCEQEIKNLLLRLRRHYIMARGLRLNEMMSNVIVGFLENLRIVLSLNEGTLPSRKEVINYAAKAFGVDAMILQNVKDSRGGDVKLQWKEEEQLYDRFMAIVERVAKITDKMK